MNTNENPLSKYFRKPGIYVQIPTGGRFNPEIEKTVLDELPILPMTAIDEISMQNPDELLNGEALVNIIRSCVPVIPNPRNLCNVDAELIFLAIKYATYGKDVEHTHTCSSCKEQADYNIDMNHILEKFPEISDIPPIIHEDLKIFVTPPKLESLTRLALMEVEQARILTAMTSAKKDENAKDDKQDMEMAKQFAISFRKVSKQNVDMLISAIDRIETPDSVVTDPDTITEFMDNVPAEIVKKVNKIVNNCVPNLQDISTFEFTCESCESKEQVTFDLNPVNFSSAG
jgi:transcription initiation factor IIE alpha subunit